MSFSGTADSKARVDLSLPESPRLASASMTAIAARTGRAVPVIKLPSGKPLPALGQGTWGFAENPRHRKDEIAALRLGLELGMSLIDAAEICADGKAEELIGAALAGRLDEAFLVSKVLLDNAT